MINHRAVVWIIAIILVLGVGAIGFVVLTQGEGAPEYVTALGTKGIKEGEFNMPAGVAVDSSGNLYVLDTGNNRIQRISPEGKALGEIGDGAGSGQGQLSGPLRMTFDHEGNLWVADTENHRLQSFDSQGKFLDEMGSLGQDPGQFSKPCGIAFDPNGNMWVADTYNHRIQKFGPGGKNVLMTLPTDDNSPSNLKEKFDTPWGVACDPLGNVYVADTNNHRIQRFTREGIWLSSWGSAGTELGKFNRPTDVLVDRDQNVFVVDSGNNRIQKFTPQGIALLEWGTHGEQARQFSNPQQMAEGPDGTLYIADPGNNRVQRYRPRVLPLFDPGNNLAVPTRPKARLTPSETVTPQLEVDEKPSKGGKSGARGAKSSDNTKTKL